MTPTDLVHWLLIASVIILTGTCLLLNRRIDNLRREWARHKQVREKLYQELADPTKIEADFEKSARAREMRDAQRSTLPREDAWPPAKVHRPKMRGAKPGNWRVQRP